jgi:hypothetical protein
MMARVVSNESALLKKAPINRGRFVTTKRLLTFALLFLLCVYTGGCKQGPKPPPISPATQDKDFANMVDNDQGIGDIETSLRYQIQLSPESAADNIIYDEKKNKKDSITGATMHIGAPQPKELWLDATVRAVGIFRGHTILIKPRIFLSGKGRDRQTIELDDILMGDTEEREVSTQKIDLLKHLGEIPEYVLVTGKLDIYFFKNTPRADADLENLDSFPSDIHTQRSGNNIEVHFNL